jgi:hypothetical protein
MLCLNFEQPLAIEKRHCYILISFVKTIDIAFKGNPIMVRRKGAVRWVSHTLFDLPVGVELCDGALPSTDLVV